MLMLFLRITLSPYPAVRRCLGYESEPQLTVHPSLWKMDLNGDPIQSVLSSDALAFSLLSTSLLENSRSLLSLQLPPLRMTYYEPLDGCANLFRFPLVLIHRTIVF